MPGRSKTCSLILSASSPSQGVTYQINGEKHLRMWLSGEDDPSCRLAMREWLPLLAEDPVGVSTARRERPGVPVYVAAVPGTYAFVDYSVVEQYNTVLILHVGNASLEDFLRSFDPDDET